MAAEEFTAPDGTKFTVDVDLTFPCRCGQTVRFGFARGLSVAVDGCPVAVHAEPRCEQFQRLDLLDFMRWVRTGVENMN